MARSPSKKKRPTKEDRIRDASNPESPSGDSERKDLPSYEALRRAREKRGIAPEGASRPRDEEEARQSSLYVGKKAKDLGTKERDFPYRSKGGTWVHPKTGEYLSPNQAKSLIRRVERKFIVRNLARDTGKSEKEIRAKLKGVSTNDIVGHHLYSKRDPKTGKTTQTRGHYETVKKKDTRKTLQRKDNRKTILRDGRRVKNPNLGKKRSVPNPSFGKVKRSRKLVTGPSTKGKKALRKLGIVAYSGESLLRY